MKEIIAALSVLLILSIIAIACILGTLRTKVDISGYNSSSFLEVNTTKTKFRIYPCGKVDKMVWQEINPNEENYGYTAYSDGSFYIENGTMTMENTTIEDNTIIATVPNSGFGETITIAPSSGLKYVVMPDGTKISIEAYED